MSTSKERNVRSPVVHIHRRRSRVLRLAALLGRVRVPIVGVLVLVLGCTASRRGFAGAAPEQPLGAIVEGVAGPGLVLQTTRGDLIPVPGDGSFAFPVRPDEPTVGATPDGAFVFTAPTDRGGSVGVSVRTQPEDPPQLCVVAPGTSHARGVAWIRVTCALRPPVEAQEPDLARFDSFL